jgi:hypothetical protein
MAQPFDTSVPNVARMYNALLGGKDNFAADRAAAAKILEIEPGAAAVARQNRDFLRRAVRFLAGEAGTASSSISALACPPPAACTRSRSRWPRKAGSSTPTTILSS